MINSLSITREQFLEKLKREIQLTGGFPSCTNTINKLSEIAHDPDAPTSKMTELILKDPSLSTKILHFVNSAFFQRGAPITTISQAVMHIGTKQLAELCANFTIIEKFLPKSKKSVAFALALEKLITTSIFTGLLNSITCEDKEKKESGYLIGTFSELGLILTSYYFPKLFEQAHEKSLQSKTPLSFNIKQLVGLEPIEISLEILLSLKIPNDYISSIISAIKLKTRTIELQFLNENQNLTKNLLIAHEISNALIGNYCNIPIDIMMRNIAHKYNISEDLIYDCIALFTQQFSEYCQTMQVQLPEIEKLNQLDLISENLNDENLQNSNGNFNYENNFTNNNALQPDTSSIVSEKFKTTIEKYLKEVKGTIQDNAPLSLVITKVMDTLVFGLKFERVLLLLVDLEKTQLQGRMFLGDSTDNLEPKNITYQLNITNPNVVTKCYFKSQVTTFGQLVFPKDTSCLAIPVGTNEHCIGVIYASFTDPNNNVISTYMIEIANRILQELDKLTLSNDKK